MRQAMYVLQVSARRRGLMEITSEVRQWLAKQEIASGLLTVLHLAGT